MINHPDTFLEFFTLYALNCDRIVEIVCGCNESSGVGYIGADIVLDKKLWAMLLELNARPGLAIQEVLKTGIIQQMSTALKIVAVTDSP